MFRSPVVILVVNTCNILEWSCGVLFIIVYAVGGFVIGEDGDCSLKKYRPKSDAGEPSGVTRPMLKMASDAGGDSRTLRAMLGSMGSAK